MKALLVPKGVTKHRLKTIFVSVFNNLFLECFTVSSWRLFASFLCHSRGYFILCEVILNSFLFIISSSTSLLLLNRKAADFCASI